MTPELQLGRIAWPVTALGPGRRVVVWVAGCTLQCPGCISPEWQDPQAGHAVCPIALGAYLATLDASLTGITLTGGEPFQQPAAVLALLSAIRRWRPQWDNLVFSGYTLGQLRQAGSADCGVLLGEIDVLIAGPYRQSQPIEQALLGSANQRLHSLSPQGRALRPEYAALVSQPVNLGLAGGANDLLIGVLSPRQRAVWQRRLGF